MSHPLTVSHRFELQYNVDTVDHKLHCYVELVATTHADPTGYDFVAANGGANGGASGAIDSIWSLLEPYYHNSGVIFGNTILQQRAGTVWNPLAVWSTAVVPVSGNPPVHAVQASVTLRCSDFARVRFQPMEISLGPGLKTSGYDPSGVWNVMEKPFTEHAVNANDPWHWYRNRSGTPLAASGAIVAVVTDLNDKLRRRRGIA